MKTLEQYRIPFTGLTLGKHTFDFEIDKRFFDEFEYSLVKNGTLNMTVSLDKQETFMTADIQLKGTIELTCDVCLNQFLSPLDTLHRLIIKFQEEEGISDITDEILVLKKSDHEIDLATVAYEYINLAVPYYSKCEEQGVNATCDPVMIERLQNLSNQPEETDEIDPRWDILKNIKNK